MNSITRSLIDAALGQIPKVGPFLSGLFDILEPDNFNADLLKTLEDIEQTLQNLENQIQALQLQLRMDQLYAESNQAEANIDSWYENHVKFWLQGNNTNNHLNGQYLSTDPGYVGAEILANGTQMLDNINSAILGQLDNDHNQWLALVIQKYLGTAANTRMNSQTDSFVEMTYKYWLHLVHLQMKGIACLRAINSDQLGQYTAVVRNNIITQGLLCQQLVNAQLANDEFTWLDTGGDGWNAFGTNIQISHDSYRYMNTIPLAASANEVCSGIEFGYPAPGSNEWGAHIASSVMNPDGSLQGNGSWADVPFGDNINLVPYNSSPFWHNYGQLNYSTDDCKLPVGSVITGIQMQVQQERIPGYRIYNDNYQAIVTYAQVMPDGTLGTPQTYTQSLNALNNANLNYVSLNQYMNLDPPSTSTPITGFGFTTLGNQLAIKVQTSLHANAFGPVLINADDRVSLFNPVLKSYMSNNNGSIGFNTTAAATTAQNFQMLGLSDPPVYGDEVYIIDAGSQPAILGVNNGAVEFGAFDDGASCKWTLVNPANVTGNYGTDPVPSVYNWSAVLLRSNSGNGDQYLCIDTSSNTIALGTPTETQGLLKDSNVTRVDDSTYYWNVRPGLIDKAESSQTCPTWEGIFEAGAAQSQLLYYWPQQYSWWLGTFDTATNTYNWKLVGNTQGFGNLADGRPFWTGDFNGDGQKEILFYFSGDGNWWLGQVNNGQLRWSLAASTGTENNYGSSNYLYWEGDFTGSGQCELLRYDAGSRNWYLGTFSGGQLNWGTAIGNTSGFGNLADGRPLWAADFNGDGKAEILFHYGGDGNWWLGQVGAGSIAWSNPGSQAMPDSPMFWTGAFTGSGNTEVMVYDTATGYWYLATFGSSGYSYKQVADYLVGAISHQQAIIAVGAFNGGAQDVMLLSIPTRGHWFICAMNGEGQFVMGQPGPTDNRLASETQAWQGRFSGTSGSLQLLLFNSLDGTWSMGAVSNSQLSWNPLTVPTPGLGYAVDGTNHVLVESPEYTVEMAD